jgi:histidyl-tRNA synthetase
LSLVASLRANGVATALYVGSDDNLKGQLTWALKGAFPFVIIMGANEQARGVAQLKDMSARTQTEVPLAELPDRLK